MKKKPPPPPPTPRRPQQSTERLAGARKGPAAFRRWLVEKLKATRWAHPESGMALEAVAEHLWVHPDALRAAQQSLGEDMVEHGRITSGLGTGALRGKCKHFAMAVPEEVLKVLRDYARLRSLTMDTMLRSVVHDLLMSPTLPETRGQGWFVWGQRFTIRHERPLLAKAWITHGAHRALQRRAQFSGSSASGLVRAVIIDILEGRRSEFQIIAGPAAMWDDETRYFVPPVAARD